MRFKGARILSTVLTMAMLVTMAPDTMRIAKAEEMEEATETMITPGDEVQQELEPEENQELDPTQVANYNPEAAKSYAYSHYGTSGEWCAGFVASCLHNAGLTSLDVASNRKVGTLMNSLQALGFQRIELTPRSYNRYYYSDNSFVSVGDVIIWYCPEGDTDNNYHWKHAAIVTNVTNSKNEIQVTQTNSRKKDSTISYYGFDDCAHTTRKVYVLHNTTPVQQYNIYLHSGIGSCSTGQMTKQDYINGGYVLPTCTASGYDFLGWSRKNDDPDEMITRSELENLDQDINLYAVYGSVQADLWDGYWSAPNVYTVGAQTKNHAYNYFAFYVKTTEGWKKLGTIEASTTLESSGPDYYRKRVDINLDDFGGLSNESETEFRLVPCKMNGELYTEYTGKYSSIWPTLAEEETQVYLYTSETDHYFVKMHYNELYSAARFYKWNGTDSYNSVPASFSEVMNPKKTGYYFDGYYTRDGEKLDLTGTKECSPRVVKYYARWQKQISSIKLASTSATITKGKTYKLSYTIAPSNAGNKSLNFTSNNTAVATVSPTGVITGKSAGTATITCKAKDGSGKTATFKITVQNPAVKVTKLTLNRKNATILKGKTLQLSATVKPTNATNKGVTWKSSNTRIATVSSSGKVTAKAAGTVTITCIAKDGSGKKATCKIQVVASQTEAFVARIYTEALGRVPDAGGLAYWTKEINTKKKTPTQVAEMFIFSDEMMKKGLSDREYVKVLYRTFMGREADTAGLNYWVGRLQAGTSRKLVMKQFAGCPEFQKIMKQFGL